MNPKTRLLLVRLGIVAMVTLGIAMATLQIMSTKNELAHPELQGKAAPK